MCDYFNELDIKDEDILKSLEPEEDLTDFIYYVVVSFFPQNEHLLEKKLKCIGEFTNCFKVQRKDEIVYVSFAEVIRVDSEWRMLLLKLLRGIADSFTIITKSKCNGTFDICRYKTIELQENWKDIKESFRDLIAGFENNLDSIDINELLDQYKTIYRKGSLVIRNIDSDVDIEDSLDYTYSIIDKFFNQLNKNIELPCPYDDIYRIMLYPNINPDIPILLRKDMPKFSDLWDKIENKEKDRYIPQGEVLGYYTRNDESWQVKKEDETVEVSCKGPHIVISPEKIIKETSGDRKSFDVLFTQVLVHEIAHAMMDKYRIVKNGEIFNTNIAEGHVNSLEAKAMEESLANMIALQIFSKYDNGNYATVRSFIENDQPTIYKFGARQFDISADWKKWKDSNKNMPTLKTWFDKCFNEGKIRDDLKYSLSDYDAVFI